MPIVDVEGLGELEFPDGMSNAEMEAAIKTHPDYKEPKTFGQKALDVAGGIAKGFNTGLGTMTKGVPVVGATVDKTRVGPQVQEFEKNHPIAATGLKTAGGIAAVAPLMAAAAPALGTGFGANALGQSAMFSGLNVADTVAKKGSDTSANDLLWAIGTGTAGGVAGAGLGKLITPNNLTKPALPEAPAPIPYKPTPPSDVPLNVMGVNASNLPKGYQVGIKNVRKQKYDTPAQVEKQTVDSLNKTKIEQHKATIEALGKDFEAKRQAARQGLASNAVTGAGGAVAGHLLMGGPWGAPLGAALAPYVREKLPDLAGNYTANMVMANPTNRAILMSIMSEISDGKD